MQHDPDISNPRRKLRRKGKIINTAIIFICLSLIIFAIRIMFLTHSIFLIRLFSWLGRFREDGIVIFIGAVVGFLSGLLGKGGSAITTPALQIFAQVNPFAALASPLPAALPTTLSASFAYKKKNLINRKVVILSILLGIPATIIGSFFSDWLGGSTLMILTAIFVLSLGISFLFFSSFSETIVTAIVVPTWKISIVAVSVGFLSGLLANSGGVLFGPLFIRFLKLPTKQALACSLLVAAGLAIPGTIVHWYLGHINWKIVLWLSISSIPFSYIGARVALQLKNDILEKIFGVMLVTFGAFDLWYSFLHW